MFRIGARYELACNCDTDCSAFPLIRALTVIVYFLNFYKITNNTYSNFQFNCMRSISQLVDGSFTRRKSGPEEDLGDKIGVLDIELLPITTLNHLSSLSLNEIENLLPVLRIWDVKINGDERFNDTFSGQVVDQRIFADLNQILKIYQLLILTITKKYS